MILGNNFSTRHLLAPNQQWKHQNNEQNLFKSYLQRRQNEIYVAALVPLLLKICTDFTQWYGVSIVGFEQLNAG